MFNNASGFQIHGGNFYNVEGGVIPHPNVDAMPVGWGQDSEMIETDGAEGGGSVGWPADESYPTIHNDPVFPRNGPSDPPPTSINGGTFISQNVNNIQRHGETGLHILYRAIAGDAFYDSADRFPQPRCHEETRTKLLDILWNWSCGVQPPRKWTSDEEHEDNNGASSAILWLHGPAGSGKSAVAQSFCENLQSKGRLGGGFFFKRDHASRGNAKKLFPTIAYQLARLLQFGQFRDDISQIVENDPSIADRSLSSQLHELIVVPCRQSRLSQPVVIVIDGLDECSGNDVQQEILSLIGNAVSRERLPILFLIASRPESHIRETLAGPRLDKTHWPLNIEESFEDVRIYLQAELDRIRREHRTMAAVPYPWPSLEIVEHLVEKSSGYFIYAATVVKFIDDKQFHPTKRLSIILDKDPDSETPFAPLDHLYLQILSGVHIQFHSSLLEILVAVHAQFALTVSELEHLLELDQGDVALILRNLHSVIWVENEYSSQVTVYHASFLDFLEDPSRSGSFHVGSSQCRKNLSLHLLKTFSRRDGDPSFNRQEELAWNIGGAPFQYIICAEPSPDLQLGVLSLNPDFLFGFKDPSETVNGLLGWLEKFNPVDEDLVCLWKDYYFMSLCDETWDPNPQDDDQEWNTPCDDTFLQLSPQLLQILYASKVLPDICEQRCLARIRFLLGLSWDDLRKVISPLQAILGDDLEGLQELRTCNFDKAFSEGLNGSAVLSELAHGALRIIGNAAQCRNLPWAVCGWGFFLRSCPASIELLQGLAENGQTEAFYRRGEPEDLHNVVQWLKNGNPSPTLMARYEHLLDRCIRGKSWTGIDYSFESLERRWMEWWERVKSA
ncbi:hypothetical protein B0H16DRAFT_1861900 [Mycena metata]|uniref:Nephrocystin 3-like N-terminal domain-containing protein n=1 Tax=Mycena metata TaxID=1033252 RepID=A0AAD7IF76_9AGAR|nr:hypothetical protein B0H16DRAFT_1861900 [Mycena metata]